MVLNAVQNAAKREGNKYKNTHQRDRPSLFEPLKSWLKRVRHPSKSDVLGAKSRKMGLKKLRDDNQTRKAKWCKMQDIHRKLDKRKGTED